LIAGVIAQGHPYITDALFMEGVNPIHSLVLGKFIAFAWGKYYYWHEDFVMSTIQQTVTIL